MRNILNFLLPLFPLAIIVEQTRFFVHSLLLSINSKKNARFFLFVISPAFLFLLFIVGSWRIHTHSRAHTLVSVIANEMNVIIVCCICVSVYMHNIASIVIIFACHSERVLFVCQKFNLITILFLMHLVLSLYCTVVALDLYSVVHIYLNF